MIGKMLSDLLVGYKTYKPTAASKIGRGPSAIPRPLAFPDTYLGLKETGQGPMAIFATGDFEFSGGRLMHQTETFSYEEVKRRFYAAEEGQPVGASSVDIEAQRRPAHEQADGWHKVIRDFKAFEERKTAAAPAQAKPNLA